MLFGMPKFRIPIRPPTPTPDDFPSVGPDGMQNGCGMNFYFGPANFRKIAGEFLSKFGWRILIANFSALLFQGFRPPKEFTPKIHVQNCQHSSPFHVLEPKIYSQRFSAYGGDQHLILGGRSESLLRKPGFPYQGSESPGNCSGSNFCPDQVLLSKNFV